MFYKQDKELEKRTMHKPLFQRKCSRKNKGLVVDKVYHIT
jgi:hypothetical protein